MVPRVVNAQRETHQQQRLTQAGRLHLALDVANAEGAVRGVSRHGHGRNLQHRRIPISAGVAPQGHAAEAWLDGNVCAGGAAGPYAPGQTGRLPRHF